MAKFALANMPYTLNDVKLGSLIPNKKLPDQDTFGLIREGSDFNWRAQKKAKILQNQVERGKILSQASCHSPASREHSRG